MKKFKLLSAGLVTAGMFMVFVPTALAQLMYKDTVWVNATLYDHVSLPEHIWWPAHHQDPCQNYTEFNMYAPRNTNDPVTGMVENTLDAESKPVKKFYAGTPSPNCQNWQPGYCPGCGWYNRDMHKWFRSGNDVVEIRIKLPFLHQGNGKYHYSNWSFYPLDTLNTSLTHTGKEQWNKATGHNLGFCMEIKTTFQYNASTASNISLNFVGDDDLWIFINKQLVLDGGGVHWQSFLNFNLKTEGDRLGLTSGNTYPMDIFYCERREVDSRLEFTTNIPVFGNKLKYNIIR